MSEIIVFCATQRGLAALERIGRIADGHKIVVVSYPEFPGEPKYLEAIEACCHRSGFQFRLNAEVKAHGWDRLGTNGIRTIIAISWRYLIPESFYSRAERGAYVFHDSMLPKYRGFSPTVWALINGEPDTGMTLFRMVNAVDAGEIVGQKSIAIEDKDDIGTLRSKGTVALLGLLDRHLDEILSGRVTSIPQDEAMATYTCKWLPEDARIDWAMPSKSIHNLIRGTTRPYTGAYCRMGERRLSVWRSALILTPPEFVGRVPGRVVEVGDGWVNILTGDSTLRLIDVSVGDGEVKPASQILDSLSVTLS